MSFPTQTSLSARRCLLQEQLRTQRQAIIARLTKADNAESQFPRSATMRFLSGRIGLKILTGLAVRHLLLRYPKALVNVFTLMQLFKKQKRTGD